MADITKKVSRATPVNGRMQNFTGADATAGDILLVEDSLGRPANNISITTTGGAMRVRFNVYQTIYPRRPDVEGLMLTSHLPNVAMGIRFMPSGTSANAPIEIPTNATTSFDGEFPVKDIEIIVASGAFDIFVA